MRILEALDISKYFQAIYGGNSFETKKPDPLGAKTILSEFKVKNAGDAMMIGDSEVDIQTARNADMIATAVNYGFGIHDRSQHPADIYLDRMSDLLEVVDGVDSRPIALCRSRLTVLKTSTATIAREIAPCLPTSAVGRLGA